MVFKVSSTNIKFTATKKSTFGLLLMNYLGHIYLSSHHDGLLVGNFIADAVKGRPEGRFNADIVRGIVMHRAIDEYTDKHPATKEIVAMLAPQYGRYAAVLVDILYDHLLASGWHHFSAEDITHYANGIYQRLGQYRDHFPDKMQLFYDRMVEYDFITNYGNRYGMEQTLGRLQIRAKTDLPFIEAMDTLEKEKDRLSSLFSLFITDLQQHLQVQGYHVL